MKLTKKRQQILNLIQSSDTPINAKFLKSKVDFDLSTVYRALEFLEKNNYIFSFDFENEKYYFKEENANFFNSLFSFSVSSFENSGTVSICLQESQIKKLAFSSLK